MNTNMDVIPRQAALVELNQALDRLLDATELHWWRQALERLAQSPDATTAAMLSSHCKRHLRARSVVGAEGWSCVELARALLLAEVVGLQAPKTRLALLEQLFQWGDDLEKIALLKVLDHLDSDGSCLDLALLAGRTSNPHVFAALALDTPYPARHYPDRAFHQLVLKALGMGLDAARVIGLAQRQSVSLNQLALDLMDEQLAAGRPVASSLPQLIAFDLLSPAQLQRLTGLYQQQRLPAHWREHLAGT
ncbi:EboA domain-containing protein [Pseudomonas sp. K1(2024)]|uniref:EboA domain-containing protein n=1 Tax=Pseudomonas boreofloridensis TaxID=3064348 RepID=A0ABV4Z9E7_9PSED|nr:EboA domain-containing protein [Pseudomonas sp. K13]MDO7902298.1 EboA domain-containing protein [Pseudomonas sp. K13]